MVKRELYGIYANTSQVSPGKSSYAPPQDFKNESTKGADRRVHDSFYGNLSRPFSNDLGIITCSWSNGVYI